MPKVEPFYCLRCGAPVELVYLPDMMPSTRVLFDSLKNLRLCSKCYRARIKLRC